ncbi:hypothetical protein RYX36_033887 [Vicia faba]
MICDFDSVFLIFIWKVCDFKKFDTNSRLQDLRPIRIPYHVPIATVLFGFALVLIAFVKGVPSSVLPSSVLAATAKSGFTAAFTLIFVSEIGDKVIYCYYLKISHCQLA